MRINLTNWFSWSSRGPHAMLMSCMSSSWQRITCNTVHPCSCQHVCGGRSWCAQWVIWNSSFMHVPWRKWHLDCWCQIDHGGCWDGPIWVHPRRDKLLRGHTVLCSQENEFCISWKVRYRYIWWRGVGYVIDLFRLHINIDLFSFNFFTCDLKHFSLIRWISMMTIDNRQQARTSGSPATTLKIPLVYQSSTLMSGRRMIWTQCPSTEHLQHPLLSLWDFFPTDILLDAQLQ